MIWRRIGGTVAGVVASTATIMAIEAIGHRLAGVPADPTRMSLPLLLVLFAWVSGATVGGFVGTTIARWGGAAWIVAGLVALGVVATAFTIPHPWWMTACGIVLPLLAAAAISRRQSGADQRVAL